MQSSEQIEKIVLFKVTSASNKKVIDDMQIAIDDIKKEDQNNKHYATFGLIIILPIVIYLSYLLIF